MDVKQKLAKAARVRHLPLDRDSLLLKQAKSVLPLLAGITRPTSKSACSAGICVLLLILSVRLSSQHPGGGVALHLLRNLHLLRSALYDRR